MLKPLILLLISAVVVGAFVTLSLRRNITTAGGTGTAISKQPIALVIAAIVVGALWNQTHFGNITTGKGIADAVLIGLVSLAFAIVLAWIPAGIYWLLKRKRMPGLVALAWTLWIVVAVSNEFFSP